jgi:thymidylate kinase
VSDPFHVAVIGIDGAGKTSLASALVDQLAPLGSVTLKSRNRHLGRRVHEALGIAKDDENAGTVDLFSSAAFVTAVYLDMAEDLDRMADELAAFDVVIWDRHLRCFSAHGVTQGLPVSWTRKMERLCPAPSLLLWLDVEVEASMARLERRDAEPRETAAYLARARAAYQGLNASDPTVIRLDGSLDPDELSSLAGRTVRSAMAGRSPR